MKLNLKRNKAIQYLGIALLILITVISSVAATPPTAVNSKSISEAAISKYMVAQSNPQLSDEEKIKTAIDAYFTTRYEGQKLLAAQDFSPLLEDNNLAWVQNEKDKREIELYIASLFDLGYQSYSFALDYDSIEIKKNKAVVLLRQSHQVVYEAIAPEISELANLQHTITLHNKSGVWVVYKDEYQDEYTRLLDVTTKDKIKQQIDENYKNSQRHSSTTFGTKVLARLVFRPLALPSYSYTRSAATTFSYNNALITQAPIPQAIKDAYKQKYGSNYPTDGSWPLIYKNEDVTGNLVGGDCTNFVSESIFEGTGYTNGDPEYFYPTPNDNNWYYKFGPPDAKGSATWINVGYLYSYLLNVNTSKRGPYGIAVSSSSFCTSINPGDPIFMKSGSTWQHAVLVYSKSSPCTSPNNIRVNSHNAYKRNEPLPTWSGFSWWGVYIQGYRK